MPQKENNMRIRNRRDKQLKSNIMIKRSLLKSIKDKKCLKNTTPKLEYRKTKYLENPYVQLIYKKFIFQENQDIKKIIKK